LSGQLKDLVLYDRTHFPDTQIKNSQEYETKHLQVFMRNKQLNEPLIQFDVQLFSQDIAENVTVRSDIQVRLHSRSTTRRWCSSSSPSRA